MELTPLDVLFNSVWWSAFWATLIISGLVALGVSIFALSQKQPLGCAIVIPAVLVSLIGGPLIANGQANESISTSWEQAKMDRAAYIEKLHGAWVSYQEERFDCRYYESHSESNGTGCRYVTETSKCTRYEDVEVDDSSSSTNSSGKPTSRKPKKTKKECVERLYMYTPWFNYERTLTAELNVFENGHRVFAEHLAPENWQSNTYRFSYPSGSFEWKTPDEWSRIKAAVDSGLPLPGSVYHKYSNWVFADDVTLFREYGGHIPKYQGRGLLPKINPIYDSGKKQMGVNAQNVPVGRGYDYDFVQFLNVTMSQNEWMEWQKTAAMWAAMAGNQLQASVIFAFAPQDLVSDRFEWIRTAKAYLMQENVFGRFILPKNTIIVLCTVSADRQSVVACVMETGMFVGNRQVQLDVEQIAPFSFSPKSFFGDMQASLVGGNAQINFSGGVIDAILRDGREGHGFHRVSMKTEEYRKALITPKPEQIEAIKSSRLFGSIVINVVIWALFLGVSAWFVSQRRS